MTREEAQKILGVSGKDINFAEKRYQKMFEMNDPTKGGSFYLQCKLLGAIETLKGKDK
jgi:import inner membrane translocase subunit TIM16